MRITITSHGFEYLETSLRASAGRAAMLRPALELVAEDMMRRTATVFDSEGRQAGTGIFRGSWAKLSEDTIKKRLRRGLPPGPILHATGRLRHSLTDRGSPDQVLRFSRSALEFGSSLESADTHQHGTQDVPARPFITFGPLDEERWAGIVALYIVDPLKNRVR